MKPDDRPLYWGAEALWQQIEPLLPGLSIEVMARIESTNSALLERARVIGQRCRTAVLTDATDSGFGRRATDARPCLLVAEHQTRGRGRMGRRWQSEAGASLTFSLSLPLQTNNWSGLSLAVGVALAEALDPLRHAVAKGTEAHAPGARAAEQAGFDPPRIGLKWPNDLWLTDGSDRKLGGVLIETVSVGWQRMAVIGVGLNVAPQKLTPGSASLQDIDIGLDAPGALARVALPLARSLRQFESGGFEAFAPRFASRDVLYQRRIVTTSTEVPEGIAMGVTSHGELRVHDTKGAEHLVATGDVSVRPTAGVTEDCL